MSILSLALEIYYVYILAKYVSLMFFSVNQCYLKVLYEPF